MTKQTSKIHTVVIGWYQSTWSRHLAVSGSRVITLNNWKKKKHCRRYSSKADFAPARPVLLYSSSCRSSGQNCAVKLWRSPCHFLKWVQKTDMICTTKDKVLRWCHIASSAKGRSRKEIHRLVTGIWESLGSHLQPSLLVGRADLTARLPAAVGSWKV